ncbi:MAG: PRC-barrel domain-containing protein [Micromonosporaceae bacterium]
MSQFDPWNYRPDAGWSAEQEIVGYHVEATDGSIGKVCATSQATDESYIVVDTGPWIFGHKVLLPAGTVTRIDPDDRKVYLDRTKEQIKSSPDYDPDMWGEPSYRDKVGGHYGDTYGSGYNGGLQGFAPGGGPAR